MDEEHQGAAAAEEGGDGPALEVAARLFGYLHGRRSFSGRVHFRDAPMESSPEPRYQRWPKHEVASKQPRPDHQAFYPSTRRRKFYHHDPGADRLTPAPASIPTNQRRTVRAAPPGATFRFRVDFDGLAQGELDLLLYCLCLEENVSVTLRREAVEPAPPSTEVNLSGPLRHKIGGCKPLAGGSSRIRILNMVLEEDALARYRTGTGGTRELESDQLSEYLSTQTQRFPERGDETMLQLRAMLVYDEHNDPRAGRIRYPTYRWFQEERQESEKTPLKPTR